MIYIRVCPKCREKFKYRFIKNMFGSPFYKLKCHKCNTRFKLTKKADRINLMLTFVPLTFGGVFYYELINFFTRFTQNDSTSFWVWVCIYITWSTIINNFNFPWAEYEF
ncbi:hypothetical protein [Clostridium sp. HCS.1]|uniref:hypothetical protein n=1 Tax=Clostridium sp. HCS.1 TaxID=3238594 RepID=UPI003A103A2E